MTFTYLFLILFSLLNTAKAELKYYDKADINKQDEILEKKEVTLINEEFISSTDEELGLVEDARYSGVDTSQYSVLGHTAFHHSLLSSHAGVEVNYARKISNFWLELFFAQINSTWRIVGENRQNADPTTTGSATVVSEDTLFRGKDTTEKLTQFGGGLRYRFKFFWEFFNNERLFQTVSALITYTSLQEGETGEKYTGLGPRVDYGIQKRSSKHFFYGLRFSYQLAFVKRKSKDSLEGTNNRRINLAWPSFAFELGLIY